MKHDNLLIDYSIRTLPLTPRNLSVDKYGPAGIDEGRTQPLSLYSEKKVI